MQAGQYKSLYPDMSLYQEIILLQNFADKKTKWVVENVNPYYKPLITGVLLQRHLFWTNFQLRKFDKKDDRTHQEIKGGSTVYNINLKNYNVGNKRAILRNMVNPELANHIFNLAKDCNYVDNSEQALLFQGREK